MGTISTCCSSNGCRPKWPRRAAASPARSDPPPWTPSENEAEVCERFLNRPERGPE